MSSTFQDIPRYILDELRDLLETKTKENMLRHLLSDQAADSNTAIDMYFHHILETVFFSNRNEWIDLKVIRSTYYRRRQMTKKNWFKQLKKEVEGNQYTPIHAEYETMLKLYKSKNVDETLTEPLMALIKDQNQFIQSRLRDIEAWSVDQNTLSTHYDYLNTKKKFQIEKAFENDIVCIICDFLKMTPKNWITHRFKSLIENPVFADGRLKMKGKTTDEQGKMIVYDDYKMSSDRFIRSFISIDEDAELEIDRMFVLDDVDSEIIEHVMENRSESFYTDKEVIFDLYPLIQRIYGEAASAKTYDLISSRLKKIGLFSIEGRTVGPRNKSTFIFNLFQSVEVEQDKETGRHFVTIRFSDKLHEQFFKKQTVQIYSHLIHRLENRLSKILIYALQKERMDAFLQKREIRQQFEYSFFTDRIRFRSTRIDTNMSLIEAALNEFKKANILIDRFQRTGMGFEICLTPLNDSEIEDFFPGSEAEKLLSNP